MKKLIVGGAVGLASIIGIVAVNSDEQVNKNFDDNTPVFVEKKLVEVEKSEESKISSKSKTTKSACHPSYSGCLNPNASDYDCAGGSGDGPYYTGQVRVFGSDVFRLDRDGDGIACE